MPLATFTKITLTESFATNANFTPQSVVIFYHAVHYNGGHLGNIEVRFSTFKCVVSVWEMIQLVFILRGNVMEYFKPGE